VDDKVPRQMVAADGRSTALICATCMAAIGRLFLELLRRLLAGRRRLPVIVAYRLFAAEHEWLYMDAPTCPSFQFMRADRIRLQPYIRTFAVA
jgi:hypothetical protein